jgi:hypothetical protein
MLTTGMESREPSAASLTGRRRQATNESGPGSAPAASNLSSKDRSFAMTTSES